MEKIITIKEGKLIQKGKKEWIELVDQDDKTYRIFKAIQRANESWCHLEKEVDALKKLIQSEQIVDKVYKLIQEQKGTFENVIAIELVENIFVKKARQETEDTRGQSIERQVAIKEIGECWRTGKLSDDNPLVYGYLTWLLTTLNIQTKDIAKSENNKIEQNMLVVPLSKEDLLLTIEGSYRKLNWWVETKRWTSPEIIKHIRALIGKPDIRQATLEELLNIVSDLQVSTV